MKSKFELYLLESESESIQETIFPKDTKLYHGTSINNCNKILKSKKFDREKGDGELGRGIYVHPNKNRISHWAYNGGYLILSLKRDIRCINETELQRPGVLDKIKKYIVTHKIDGFDNIELLYQAPKVRLLQMYGFDGIYSNSGGRSQITHQILLFHNNINNIIDWGNTSKKIYNDNEDNYLSDNNKKYYY